MIKLLSFLKILIFIIILYSRNDASPHRRYRQFPPNRVRKSSSFSSINNDSTPQTSSSQQGVSQTPHSLQQVQQQQQKSQAFTEANQQINIQLHQPPNSIEMINNPKRSLYTQASRLKQIDEAEESISNVNIQSQDYVLTHQQTTISHEKFLHIPSDVTSNNINYNPKKINSQVTLNSQKAFFKQPSKNNHQVNENYINQSVSQQISKQEPQNISAKHIQENSLFLQENSVRVNKNQFGGDNWQVASQRQNFMILSDFDKIFPFQIYFPESNVDKILLLFMKRRKTIQNVQKVYDMKLQEDKLKQIRSNLNLNKERSRYKQSTKIQQRSSHQLNQSLISLNQINHEQDILEKSPNYS